MFGVELERMWGTRFFVAYYSITGIGGGLTMLLSRCCRSRRRTPRTTSVTVGASGAIYGLLLAYALYFPHRPILLFLLFPVPVRVFVMIVGAIALLNCDSAPARGVAHTAHLGGSWSATST